MLLAKIAMSEDLRILDHTFGPEPSFFIYMSVRQILIFNLIDSLQAALEACREQSDMGPHCLSMRLQIF